MAKDFKKAEAVKVFCFAVRIQGIEHETYYNAATSGQAKYRHYREVLDPLPDLKFTQLRVRKVGPVQTSAEFHRNAIYRGMEHVKCGDRVRVGVNFGTIVGHNCSANFDVLFDPDSKYGAQVLNVHPAECELQAGGDVRAAVAPLSGKGGDR
jgi:hypothetical protein